MSFSVEVRVRRSAAFALQAAFRTDAATIGIVGPSGSGKSTLLDAMAGVVRRAGHTEIGGRDLTDVPLHERAVGYVTQDPLLFPHLSVRDNVLYSPRAGSAGDVIDALDLPGLLDRMPRNLSGGERRRVALARAIASRPTALLLDEPFAGLDAPRRRDAMSLLDRVRRRFSLPMALVSHVAEEVVGLTEWAVRLEEGRVVATGPSASVLRRGEAQIDNFFAGQVVAAGRVRVGPIELVAALPPEAAGEVRLACYAHEILLARETPRGISARNCIRSRISAVEPAGGAALVALQDLPLRALVTEQASDELAIHPGAEVTAVIKATSIAYLGGGS